MRRDTIVHGKVEWHLYDPDRLPARRFGTWAIIATHDKDHHTLLEMLGTGVGAAMQHAAIVRSATWTSSVQGRVCVGVADAAALRMTGFMGTR